MLNYLFFNLLGGVPVLGQLFTCCVGLNDLFSGINLHVFWVFADIFRRVNGPVLGC